MSSPPLLLLAFVLSLGIFMVSGLGEQAAWVEAWHHEFLGTETETKDENSLYNVPSQTPRRSATEVYNLGVRLFRAGDLRGAQENFVKALLLNPRDYSSLYNLGVIAHRVGRLEDALVFYHQAIDANPTHAPSYNNAGIVLQALGRVEEARASFHEALRADPSFVEAQHNIAIVLQQQGRLLESEEVFASAIRNADSAQQAGSFVANFMALLVQMGRVEEAVNLYRSQGRVKGLHAETLFTMAAVLEEAGLGEEAHALYDDAFRAKPQLRNVKNIEH